VAVTPEYFMHRGKRWKSIPAEPFQRYLMGVDFGQSVDHTGIAIMHHHVTPLADAWDADERTCRVVQKCDEFYDIRYLERVPLGVRYPDQIAHIQRLLIRPPLRDQEVPVCFDTTSNLAVADDAEAAGLKPIRIHFTSGYEPQGQGRKWGVPKSVLVSTLDAKLHTGQLRFSNALLAGEALKDELQDFERHVSATGRMLFEHRSGRHDDLIFSVALPLWWSIRCRKFRVRAYGARGLY